MMKFKDLLTWLFIYSTVFLYVTVANADVRLTDNFSVAGLLRQEVAVHTGEKNPNLPGERNSLNLSRSFFFTEWTYTPNDNFKVFSKVKLISDQTAALDDKLSDYNAFPLATPRYGAYLRATNDHTFALEMSELYADASFGNLWLRLGKQQIVWGEVIGARILDQINPLDLSWHFQLEPEEFENIRVPEWALRGRYNLSEGTISWLGDVYLEGFVNPGDVSPTIDAAAGAPFKLRPDTLPIFRVHVNDRRGDPEFGFRIGARAGQFAATLNYLYLYSDAAFLESKAPLLPGPPTPANPFPTEQTYELAKLYGVSLNYAFPQPINTTVTYEATFSPDEPYYDKASALPRIHTAHTLKQAIICGASVPVLPKVLFASPAPNMSVQFQYAETQIWDNDQLKSTAAPFSSGSSTANNNVDADQHGIALILSQDLWHNNINLNFKVIYDLDDAHLIQPGIKYRQGNHWIFDIYAVKIGGPESRPGRFGGASWANEVFGRVTYQF